MRATRSSPAHGDFPGIRTSPETTGFAAGFLGPSGASPDATYAFGHGHLGMISARMTGKVVADLVAGRPPSVDIVPFSAAGSPSQGGTLFRRAVERREPDLAAAAPAPRSR